jgi:hypothetical protein
MAISLVFYKFFILLKIPSALDSTFIQQALTNLVPPRLGAKEQNLWLNKLLEKRPDYLLQISIASL